MSIERVSATNLWKKSLGDQSADHQQLKEGLRSSFYNFRAQVSHLVSRVSASFSNLTQHDISHLDALWETADLICGENYSLNPLEGFVLGGAILLHDAALCFEAYDNGIEGVRATTKWKDIFAHLSDFESNKTVQEKEFEADFFTIRALHADQTKALATRSWSLNDQHIYLINDETLRIGLGSLIGEIASSHHWDVDELSSKLPKQINALSDYPRVWRIDPIKIACVLRCADAAHIDNERAPDFLHALIKRQGLSYNHWQAQNKLMPIDIDQSDSSCTSALYTATSKFKEADSDAWWIAYDTICMIDQEISDCNNLLESRNTEPFQVKKILGTDSPASMSQYLPTEDWIPSNSKIHISNVEGLVKNLGGEKLYGNGIDKLEVVLRELIQNARDSIKAREVFDQSHEGKIAVKFISENNHLWLIIEDNGVGMSKRVLTGPLLDFGTSFWTSTLVQTELPGLRSSSFKSVGKFGIGFYSVFMIADEVIVSSKPWNAGDSSIWQVHFKHGLTLRPLLKNKKPSIFSSRSSTTIRLRIISESIYLNQILENRIPLKKSAIGANEFSIPLKNYLSVICAGLDVDVELHSVDRSSCLVHKNIKKEQDWNDWLNTISFADYQVPAITNLTRKYISKLRRIMSGDRQVGFASIYLEQDAHLYLDTRCVGGLASTIRGRGNISFVGYIDYLPESARRDGQVYAASEEVIKSWANEQKELWSKEDLTPLESYVLASSLCEFGVDPIDIAQIYVSNDGNTSFLSFADLASLAFNKDICVLKSKHLNDHIETHHHIFNLPNKILILPLKNNNFLSLEWGDDGMPKNNNSILDCLARAIVALGKTPIFTSEENVGVSLIGQVDALIIRAT